MVASSFWFLLLSVLLPAVVECSSGDRSHEFRWCVTQCNNTVCADGGELTLVLRAFWWTCLENCQYECMHNVTAQDVSVNRPVRQFFGKWPFVRFLGIQEPASTLFSVLNGLAIFVGYVLFRRSAPKAYPYHPLLWFQFWVSLHTWFWSSVFHSRDLFWTERLDYFSAASMIVVGVAIQFVRITGPQQIRWHILYACVWVLLYCCHVGYLSIYKFDYGYNMAACVGAGTVYAGVWVIWCLKHIRQRPYVWKCIVCVMSTTCFLSLELLDFPPLLWTFDAHSLWHMSTVPLPLLWYSFLTDDAKFESAPKISKKQI